MKSLLKAILYLQAIETWIAVGEFWSALEIRQRSVSSSEGDQYLLSPSAWESRSWRQLSRNFLFEMSIW